MSTFGPVYVKEYDAERIQTQMDRIRFLMLKKRITKEWLTLSEIRSITGYSEASISAQLRHLRKKQFGSFIVNKRARGDRKNGLFEYQVDHPLTSPQKELF